MGLGGTLSEDDVVEARERRCDLGYLRVPYTTHEGRLGYRCSAEPVEDYVRKGGDIAETVGRKCICNGLTATIGLGQRRQGVAEPPIMTAGNDLIELGRFLSADRLVYSAQDVVAYLLDEPTTAVRVVGEPSESESVSPA